MFGKDTIFERILCNVVYIDLSEPNGLLYNVVPNDWEEEIEPGDRWDGLG